ncbi:MAG: hypothetical protein ACFE9C_07515 [Candidatus Hodarchaeota archaeon]
MKNQIFRLWICIILVNITVVSLFLLTNGYCATKEINSEYGKSPVIDGYIDLSAKEWDQAFKDNNFYLEDLPINLWVMQDNKNLYISIQFDLLLDHHSTSEFIGLIVSNSSSEVKEEFIDAKIIQFSNISADEYNYYDYNVNGSFFNIDLENDGDGAAKLEGFTSTYEFSLPIKGVNANEEDAALDYGNGYVFNITYGETPIYPAGIKKSTIVLINIKSSPTTTSPIINIVLYVLNILAFSFLGILLGFYSYRIFKLKEHVEKYRR